MTATNNTKQAAWVAIGSFASFGFALVSSMILSRFLSKADYGTYKQVMYVYETLLVVFTLGLPRAYSFFLPRVPLQYARNLIIKISLLFLILGALMSILLYSQAHRIALLLNNDDLEDAIRLFSVVPIIMLPTMGLDGILASFKRAKLIAFYNISTRILMLLFVALPVMLFNQGYKGAIVGFVAASILSFIIAECMIFVPLRSSERSKCDISYKQIFAFSLPLLLSSFWGIIQNSSDQFFISRYFGNETYAEFANGNMELPFVGMIIGACATVLSPLFSERSQGEQDPKVTILPTWKNVFEKSAMIVYPIALYAIFFADIIMVFLYGNQYESSSIYFRIKTIISFFNVIAVGPLLINVGKVRIYSNVQLWCALFIVLFEFLLVKLTMNPIVVPIIQLLGRTGGTLVYLVIIAKYFGVVFFDLFPYKSILFMLFSGLLILIPLKVFFNFIELNVIVSLVLSFTVFALLFFVICRRKGIDYLSIISSLRS